MEIVYKDESYRIMGACFEVYKEMGCGFTEPVYHECLALEITMQELPFLSKQQLTLSYKGHQLQSKFIPDFILFDKIVLEIKAVKELTNEFRSKVHNYLHASGFRLALLVNFGHYPKIEYERIVM